MPILPVLLIIFFSVPLLEVYLLLKVSGSIGVLWTILLVILTAVMGSILIRVQGFSLLLQLRQQLSTGHLPTEVVFSGACLLLAGALLLTPGFFTDFIGFVLLTPFLRAVVYQYLVLRLKSRVKDTFDAAGRRPAGQNSAEVIEGEFHEEPDRQNKPKNLP